MNRFKNRLLIAILFFYITAGFANEKIMIVTTLPDLKNIAELIGGDKVDAFAIAKGYQNPHFVDPKPSYIINLSRADIFITVGLDLETSWSKSLLNSARNANILPGSDGYVDVSSNVPLLNVPTNTERSEGDIHIFGNPHYWLDPLRGEIIAENIYGALIKASPENKQFFADNLENFKNTINEKMVKWVALMQPFQGRKIIAYHDEWPYFEKQFGLEIVEFLEPKPGIPPTPSQLVKVISIMEKENIKVIINSPYFQAESAELVARKTEGIVVTLATSVGAFDSIKNYYDLFDYNIQKLIEAFKEGD
jgi:zinc/manganese transport system substrate-binding protein